MVLDNFRKQHITWDKANRKVYENVRVSSEDENGRKLAVQIVNDGVVEDLTGFSLNLAWETKDKVTNGLDAFEVVDISKGQFAITYKTGMLQNVGNLNAQLVLIGTDTSKITSENFTITVFGGVGTGGAESSNEFSALTTALATVNQYDSRIESKADKSTTEQSILSLNQQLAEIVKSNRHEKKIVKKSDKTVGWQFTKGNKVDVAHNDLYSQVPLTIDLLIGLNSKDLIPPTVTELEVQIANKPNSWSIKVADNGYFGVDFRNNDEVLDKWVGEIWSKTASDFPILNEIEIESYGVSQGLATDGTYIYTSNNRADMNPYHVHKRKKDGTLLKGYVLPTGFTHPCGMDVVGSLLYVPSNDYNNGNYINHKIFVFDTAGLTLIKEYDVSLNSGGGISGITHRNGLFYASDWQVTGNTNIFVYNSDFSEILKTFSLPVLQVQGIDIAGDKIYVASNESKSIIVFDIDTQEVIGKYPFFANVEGEDLCITENGTILHGDVSTIREYQIREKNHYERVTVTISKTGNVVTGIFYLNGIKQGERVFTGSLNNLTSYGIKINGNYNAIKTGRFKIRAFGISNSILKPSKDNEEVFNRERYKTFFINPSLNINEIVDVAKNGVITKDAGIYLDDNYDY